MPTKKLVIFYDGNNINKDTKSYINAINKEARNCIERGNLLEINLLDVNLYKGYSIAQIIKSCDGFILAEPIAENIKKDTKKTIINLNMEHKDLDGFLNPYCRCTVGAVVTKLSYATLQLSGKDVCIVGRNLGKYIASALIDLHATVQVCNSRTKDLEHKMKSADIIICCAPYGKKLINSIKGYENKIIVDVGNNVSKDMYPLTNVITYKTIGTLNTQILLGRLLEEYK